ncbi:hypothetical protein N7530_000713 [Penicillium desertorum]|uniref:Uncharacterized protein n=1 Tax=Penicillium desertorum TaxID=1303715 RepID=A0A9W9X8M5_9EURO|nr:hypothetical protein N7530_000713 [Penicillium desertorum]
MKPRWGLEQRTMPPQNLPAGRYVSSQCLPGGGPISLKSTLAEYSCSLSAIAPNEASYCTIRTAINPRRIMVNDIAGFSNDSQYLLWMMWWPLKPYKSATRLGRQVCIHAPHIALTCVMPDYESTEAPFYVQDLENRAADQGWQEKILPSLVGTRATLDVALEPTTNVVRSVVRPSEMDDDYGFGGIYDGGQPRPGQVERYVWLSPETT